MKLKTIFNLFVWFPMFCNDHHSYESKSCFLETRGPLQMKHAGGTSASRQKRRSATWATCLGGGSTRPALSPRWAQPRTWAGAPWRALARGRTTRVGTGLALSSSSPFLLTQALTQLLAMILALLHDDCNQEKVKGSSFLQDACGALSPNPSRGNHAYSACVHML